MVIICNKGLVFVEERGINGPELLIFSNDSCCSRNYSFDTYDYKSLTICKSVIITSQILSTRNNRPFIKNMTRREASNVSSSVACWKINLDIIEHLIYKIRVFEFDNICIIIVTTDGEIYIKGVYYAHKFENWTHLIFVKSVAKLFICDTKIMIIDSDGKLWTSISMSYCGDEYTLNADLVKFDYDNNAVNDINIEKKYAIMHNGQIYNYKTGNLLYDNLPPIISVRSYMNRSLLDENGHLHFYPCVGEAGVIVIDDAVITHHAMTLGILFFVADGQLYYKRDAAPVIKIQLPPDLVVVHINNISVVDILACGSDGNVYIFDFLSRGENMTIKEQIITNCDFSTDAIRVVKSANKV